MGCGKHKGPLACLQELQVFREYDFIVCRSRGATSQVHEAICKDSGETVAIKCIVRKEVEALGNTSCIHKAEEMWSQLRHPNICRLLATYDDSDLHYIVMEFCDG